MSASVGRIILVPFDFGYSVLSALDDVLSASGGFIPRTWLRQKLASRRNDGLNGFFITLDGFVAGNRCRQ